MGSPITFSGFNQIDFNVVLNAIMQQESIPLQALQAKQQALQATDSAFAQLASRLDALRAASSTLATPSKLTAYAASSTDTAAVTASASSSAASGRYEIVVNELARAQVTVSNSYAPDTDTTIVASGGSLTIGTAQVTLSGPVTLRQLVSAINATADSPATASIVATASGQYRLVLTSKSTGAANAFTIDNQLTAGTITFTDTNGDNISGDSDADNVVKATDASLLVNNIPVTSASNSLDAVIPGVTVTLLQKDLTKTVVVSVDRDDAALADKVDAFVSAFNDLVKFANDQSTAANKGTPGAIGRDSLLRGLRNSLRDALTGSHGSGAYTRLAEIGIGFTRTGELSLDSGKLTEALAADPAAVQALFSDASTGVFGSIDNLIDDYTAAGGFVPGARTRLTDQISRVGRRMDDMQARLAIRRAALQQEFIAADQAMSRLNSQKASLASFGSNLSNSSF
jgi:flagellar hook-associated protein 2